MRHRAFIEENDIKDFLESDIETNGVVLIEDIKWDEKNKCLMIDWRRE